MLYEEEIPKSQEMEEESKESSSSSSEEEEEGEDEASESEAEKEAGNANVLIAQNSVSILQGGHCLSELRASEGSKKSFKVSVQR